MSNVDRQVKYQLLLTKEDLIFMILAVSHYADHEQAYGCVRVLTEALESTENVC